MQHMMVKHLIYCMYFFDVLCPYVCMKHIHGTTSHTMPGVVINLLYRLFISLYTVKHTGVQNIGQIVYTS